MTATVITWCPLLQRGCFIPLYSHVCYVLKFCLSSLSVNTALTIAEDLYCDDYIGRSFIIQDTGSFEVLRRFSSGSFGHVSRAQLEDDAPPKTWPPLRRDRFEVSDLKRVNYSSIHLPVGLVLRSHPENVNVDP